MTFSTLNTLRWDLSEVMVEFCKEASFLKLVHTLWRESLLRHIEYLAIVMNIPREVKEKYYYGYPELKLLSETCLKHSIHMDVTLQHILLWNLMFYTACRPSSLISTKDYPHWYLRYKNVQLLRVSGNGGFALQVEVTAWKGGHGFDRWSQWFRLRGVLDANALIADAPVIMIAIGLRRHAFKDHDSLDSLLNGQEHHIEWKPELMELPVFASHLARGRGVIQNKAMGYECARTFLRRISSLAGLGEEDNTTYCWRRGSANTLSRILGSEMAKSLLQHEQHTDTIHNNYSINAAQVDLVAAVLDGKQDHILGLTRHDAPAMFRSESVHNITPLSLEQALIMSPEFRLATMQKMYLKQQVEVGENSLSGIKNHLVDEDHAFVKDLLQEDEDAPIAAALYTRIRLRCNRLLSTMRQQYSAFQRQQAHQSCALTINDLQDRLKQSKQGTDLIALLRQLSKAAGQDEVVECQGRTEMELQGDTPDSPHDPQQERVRFICLLVDYTEIVDGPQICETCYSDPLLQSTVRETIYPSLAKLVRHQTRWHTGRRSIHVGNWRSPTDNIDTIILSNWEGPYSLFSDRYVALVQKRLYECMS